MAILNRSRSTGPALVLGLTLLLASTAYADTETDNILREMGKAERGLRDFASVMLEGANATPDSAKGIINRACPLLAHEIVAPAQKAADMAREHPTATVRQVGYKVQRATRYFAEASALCMGTALLLDSGQYKLAEALMKEMLAAVTKGNESFDR